MDDPSDQSAPAEAEEAGGQVIDPASPGDARAAGPRSEAREQAILHAALELVVDVGYDRLSMDALAERAHASKATIYRHWSGKADVVASALRCRAHEIGPVPDTGSLRADLLELLCASCEAFTEEDGPLMASVLWAMRNDRELAELMHTQVLEHKQDQVNQVVTRAVARGEVPAGVDPAVASEVVSSMVLKRLLVSSLPLDEEFRTALVDQVVLPLLRLVPPPPDVTTKTTANDPSVPRPPQPRTGRTP